jgi:hypothetical protein
METSKIGLWKIHHLENLGAQEDGNKVDFSEMGCGLDSSGSKLDQTDVSCKCGDEN